MHDWTKSLFFSKIIAAQTEKINEMAAVMIQAASYVEEKEVHLEEIISRLRTENQVGLCFSLFIQDELVPYIIIFTGLERIISYIKSVWFSSSR